MRAREGAEEISGQTGKIRPAAGLARTRNSTAGTDAGGGLISPFTHVAYALIEVGKGSGKRLLAASERTHGASALQAFGQRRRAQLVAPKSVRGQVVGWG
jgi:hypothetical protein